MDNHALFSLYAFVWAADFCVSRKEGRTWEDLMLIDKAPTVTTETKAKVSLAQQIWKQSHSTMLLLLLSFLFIESIAFLSPVLVG